MTPLLIKEYVSMIVDALPYLMCENINKTWYQLAGRLEKLQDLAVIACHWL